MSRDSILSLLGGVCIISMPSAVSSYTGVYVPLIEIVALPLGLLKIVDGITNPYSRMSGLRSFKPKASTGEELADILAEVTTPAVIHDKWIEHVTLPRRARETNSL